MAPAETPDTKSKTMKPVPLPDSDFYQFAAKLDPSDLALLKQVRLFMEEKVAPVIDKYWAEDAFPFELLPAFRELKIGGLGLNGYGCRGGSQALFGMIAMEMARTDASPA
jgi:alkylation response protein AidB-like acyl-CoA dehydrogenase